MRRHSLLLLSALRLCWARSPGFSIHDDLFAFPQVRDDCTLQRIVCDALADLA